MCMYIYWSRNFLSVLRLARLLLRSVQLYVFSLIMVLSNNFGSSDECKTLCCSWWLFEEFRRYMYLPFSYLFQLQLLFMEWKAWFDPHVWHIFGKGMFLLLPPARNRLAWISSSSSIMKKRWKCVCLWCYRPHYPHRELYLNSNKSYLVPLGNSYVTFTYPFMPWPSTYTKLDHGLKRIANCCGFIGMVKVLLLTTWDCST